MTKVTNKANSVASSETESCKRTRSGLVVGAKANKTISVLIERKVKHPLYGKYIRRSTKLLAHDEGNNCQAGDMVTIEESRPYSKRKSWKLVTIDSRAE